MRDDDDPGTPVAGDDSPQPRRSRWSVAPGSVDDTYGSRAAAERSRRNPFSERRRPASEILAEARESGTLPSRRRPTHHEAGSSADPTAPPSATEDPAGPRASGAPGATADHTAEVAGQRHYPPPLSRSTSHAADPEESNAPPTDDPAASGREHRADAGADSSGATSSPRRVKPDLGEAKELRSSDQIGAAPVVVLAGFGGVILILVVAAAGTILDVIFSSRVGFFTAIGLCIGAFLAALITRKKDLLTVVVAPPIVYATLSAIVLLTGDSPLSITTIAGAAISGFAPMAIATGIAAIIAGIKLITTRQGERR